jgi:RNA polymerase sigma-70 factor (ECF subfamily)
MRTESSPPNDRPDAAGVGVADAAAFGLALDSYRDWLKLLARVEIDRRLRAKLDDSDIVQETYCMAVRDRASFRGSTARELAAWLRGILSHVIANEVRRYLRSRKRRADLEVPLEQDIRRALDRSSLALGKTLAAGGSSPSERVAREEDGLLLARALARLPEDHQEVVRLRGLEDLPHEEIARRMGRSEAAVKMLWIRALGRLRREMDGEGSG